MSMITYEFDIQYERDLPNGKKRIRLELNDPDLRERFRSMFFPPALTKEDGLTYAKAPVTLAQVFDFVGRTFDEAVTLVPHLKRMHEWRAYRRRLRRAGGLEIIF